MLANSNKLMQDFHTWWTKIVSSEQILNLWKPGVAFEPTIR